MIFLSKGGGGGADSTIGGSAPGSASQIWFCFHPYMDRDHYCVWIVNTYGFKNVQEENRNISLAFWHNFRIYLAPYQP